MKWTTIALWAIRIVGIVIWLVYLGIKAWRFKKHGEPLLMEIYEALKDLTITPEEFQRIFLAALKARPYLNDLLEHWMERKRIMAHRTVKVIGS